MGVIKQIAVHDGQSWGSPKDIGANAENVSYSYSYINNNNNINISNAEQAFDNIFSRVSNLEQTSDLTDLQNRVYTLETDNTTNKTNITNLTGQINGLNSNKLSISGGTVSGNLTLQNDNDSHDLILNQNTLLANSSNIIINDDTIQNELSIENNSSQGLFLNSEDYPNYAGIQGYQKINSNIPYLRINNERTINGSLIQNNLLMGIDSEGDSIIQMSDPSAWRQALLSGTQPNAWKEALNVSQVPSYSDYKTTSNGGKILTFGNSTTEYTIKAGLDNANNVLTCNLAGATPGIYLCFPKITWRNWGTTAPTSRPGTRMFNVTKTSKSRVNTINYMSGAIVYQESQDLIQTCIGWYEITSNDSVNGNKIYLVCGTNASYNMTIKGVYFVMIPLALNI